MMYKHISLEQLPIDTTWWRCVNCGLNFFSDEIDGSQCECGCILVNKMGTLEDYNKVSERETK